MTLAVAILLFGFSSAPPLMGRETAWLQSAQQSDATQNGSPSSIPESNPQTTTETQGKPSPSPTTKKPPSHKRSRKPANKATQAKTAAPGCDTSLTVSAQKNGADGGNSSTPSATSAGADQSAPKNCPPEKIVVRHGGTTEPSIQLAGGEQETQKRNETNQMLGSTDANLKKISAIQLSADQQDTVSQIKQFVVESRAALAAGDLERGHTLAWKAQLLSEDLVKPQK